jgi:hypothetical protein
MEDTYTVYLSFIVASLMIAHGTRTVLSWSWRNELYLNLLWSLLPLTKLYKRFSWEVTELCCLSLISFHFLYHVRLVSTLISVAHAVATCFFMYYEGNSKNQPPIGW